jgi:putative ABC transport system substrate-binding protein
MLADRSKLPAIYQFSAFVELGGLASYGADLKIISRKSARYVDKILNGANPAELPVEQPVVFDLALNLKAAASLGITIPPSVISRADKVIE